jgi:hypothetical protein
VKQAARINFKTLRQSLMDPQFTTSDFGKIDRERQLLLGFQVCLHVLCPVQMNCMLSRCSGFRG